MRASGIAFVFVEIHIIHRLQDASSKVQKPHKHRDVLQAISFAAEIGHLCLKASLRESITDLLQQLVPGHVGVEGVLEQVLPWRGKAQLRLCMQGV